MKKAKGITTRIAAMLLSGMMVIGAVPTVAFGSEIEVNPDPGQTTDVVVEDSGENRIEGDMIEQDSDAASQEEEVVTSYTVTLDANGGYFVNEWDDALNETLETAETVTKLIPIGGTVTTFPVLEQENANVTFLGWSLVPNGELVSQGYEEYVPVDNCVLYAVWSYEDAVSESEVIDETMDDVVAESSFEEEAAEVDDAEVAESSSEAFSDTEIMDDDASIDSLSDDNGINEDQENLDEGVLPEATVEGDEIKESVISEQGDQEIVSSDAALSTISSGTCGDDLTWTLDSAGTLTISGTGEMVDYNYQGGPWTKKSVKKIVIEPGVLTIGTSAFESCENVTSAEIPQGVVSIGDWAFQFCYNLTTIDIPETVESIGFEAFKKCTKLNNILIPERVNKIGGSAFEYCKNFTDIIVPRNITSIEMWAFSECTNLKNVTIEDGVSTIQKGAFYGCSNLSSIVIPASVTDIWEEAFTGCPSTLIIYGVKGSYAEQYAKDNGITFNAVDLPGETQQFNIHFDLAGGTLPVNIDYQVTNGEKYGYNLSYVPERQGYNFLGWFTALNGGNRITVDTVVSLTEDQTLYAHWEEATFVVTFDPNGGTVTPTSKTYKGYVTYGELPQPVKKGYDFAGWFNGNNGPIKSDTAISFVNHSLKAHWEHTIEFDANGGTVSPETKKVIEDTYGDLPIPVKEGYIFDGWFKSVNGEDQVMDYDKIDISASKEKLYAHWSVIKKYKIDHWNFPNSTDYFGKSYYITDDDKKKLYSNLSEKEVKTIEERFFSHPLLFDGDESSFENDEIPTRKPNWNGSCQGMSCWSALVASGTKSATSVAGKNKLTDYSATGMVESAINFYHVQECCDAFVNEARRFVLEHQDKQIQELEEMLQACNSDTINVPVIIEFDYKEHYSKSERAFPEEGEGAHTIVGYRLDEGDYTENVLDSMRSIGREDAIDTSWKFTEQIYVYDPNNPDNVSAFYISKNTDKYIWCYPLMGLVSTEAFSSDKNNHSNNAFLGICTNNIEILNIVDYENGSVGYKENSNQALPMNISSKNKQWSLSCQSSDGKALFWDIDGKISSGEEKLLVMSVPGTSDNTQEVMVFPPESDSYVIKSEEEPLDFILNSENILNVVQAGSNGTVKIQNKIATVQADESTNVRISMTSNEYFPGTSWHTVEAYCKNAEDLSMRSLEDEGMILSGDLKNTIIITVTENRQDVFEKWPISTDYDSILIKEENDELVSYVDKDGNGSYESPLSESGSGTETNSGTCGDNLTWTLDDQGTLTISGTGEMYDYDYQKNPWLNLDIKKVIVEDGVTCIGCNALRDCKNVVKVLLPDSLTEIKHHAFEGCSIKTVTIPTSVTAIGIMAFFGCKELQTISIPKDVKYIGSYSFSYCTKLDNASIETDITGDAMFLGCENLRKVALSPETICIEGSAFSNCVKLESISIPSKCLSIKAEAFRECGKLDKMILPSGLKSIGSWAFIGCSGIQSIEIPSSVTSIGQYAFCRCGGLKSIEIPSSITGIGEGVFYECVGLSTISIPSSIKRIEEKAFYNCKKIESVTIPDSVTSIGKMAFGECDNLSSITIPDSVTFIGINAFKGNQDDFIIYGELGSAAEEFAEKESYEFICLHPKSIDGAVITVSDQVYTGEIIVPAIDVTLDGKKLEQNKDFVLTCKNNCNVGTAKFVIEGQGNYKGSVTGTFYIKAASVSESSVAGITDRIYSGKALTQTLVVKNGSTTLKANTDYTVAYKNNTNAGTATVTITGKGNYTGTKTITFKINPSDLSSSTVTGLSDKTYTGQAITQTPVVKTGSTTLKEGTDYTVFYENNTNPGIATVTITGIGNYTGKKEVTFTINAVGWTLENGEWYYYKSDGSKLTSGWVKDSKGWYWLDASGKITKSKWIKSGGSWYYLGSDGIMTTGWQKVDGKWYYMNSSGIMTTGWQKVGGKWYYMNPSGIMTTGWQQIGGKWYYMNSSGIMTTGWQQISGKWYYMNSSGIMTTGWQQIGGNWYYMTSSGIMTTGWQQIGGKWYYMKSSGIMTTGWQVISGKWYYFNASGVWVR